jgi:hypothetical protein
MHKSRLSHNQLITPGYPTGYISQLQSLKRSFLLLYIITLLNVLGLITFLDDNQVIHPPLGSE